MFQLTIAILALIGIIYFIVKTSHKSSVEEKKEELNNVLDASKVLDIEEEITKEQIKQKGRITKINQQKEKLESE